MPCSSFLLRGACSVQITALWPHSVLNAKPSLRAGACKQFSLTPSHRGGSRIPNVLCRFLLLTDGRAIRSMPIRNGELFVGDDAKARRAFGGQAIFPLLM